MVQMQSWFGWRPLNSGDSARMMAVLRTPDPAGLSSVRLIGDTLALELPPLRILSAKPEINWRLRILGPGQARLLPGDGQESEVFPIAVGPDRFIPVWPERLPGSWWNNLWAAGQPPLPPASAFEKLALEYPEREMSLLGWKMNWIWIFLLETLLFGFLLKGIFKVEF
jgi:hypothetical protein